MKSATGIVPEEFFTPDQSGNVINFLVNYPIDGREKANLLFSWAQAVGAKLSSSQYAQVYNSGLDTTLAGGEPL